MQFIAFIVIFGVIVLVHEFGHFYFAKKSGILVREFSIGMGPKIFAHIGQDGTAYTIRILPLGGYVRMAGWGEDTTEIKTGTPVSLTLNEVGKVVRINLSGKNLDGMDAVFSIMQMPPGVPVATVAIDGAKNAAILAAKILAASDEELLNKLKAYTAEQKEAVKAKAAKLDSIGYEAYLASK